MSDIGFNKYLNWLLNDHEDEDYDLELIQSGSHHFNDYPESCFSIDKSGYARESSISITSLIEQESLLEQIFYQINNEFDSFFSKLLQRTESQDDKRNLSELKNSIYEFYLYLILPDIKSIIEDKKSLKQNGENHPEIKKLLSKIFFLTSFTYEVLSGNIQNVKKTFNRIPGRKIGEKRLLSYIMVTRMVESEGLSERFCIRKLSQQLTLFDQEQNDIDYDKYENFVRAYNKWKNENSKYQDLIIESIRQGMSDENILQKIRTLSFN